LNFDGSGDYVMCDLVSIDTAVTGGLTVCGWINRPAGGDHKLCSNRQVANAAGGGFTCAVYNDHMEMDICDAAARTLARDSGGPALPVSTWAHVAYVFDDVGNLFKEYQDGVLTDTDAVTNGIGISTAPFRIGGAGASGKLYIDDIRLFPKAGELVTPVDPGTAGLLAWYKFDGDLKDAMGKNPGAAMTNVTTTADPTRGQVLLLDGGDGVDVPALGSTTTLTIAMWANMAISVDPTTIQFASLFHSEGWAAGDLHWRFSYGKVNAGVNSITTGDIAGQSVIATGEWNHAAVTISETEWALWFNGVKEARLTLTAPVTTTLGDGLIGAWFDGTTVSRGFTGMLDDARFYNRALSQDEIAFLAGRTAFAKPF
jgi:hypothetical protein